MAIMPDGDLAQQLSAFLRQRYEQLKDTPDRVTQAELAKTVNCSDAYVGLLHKVRGSAIYKWQGQDAFRFIQAHKFTTSEVRDIATRFELRNVLSYLQMRDASAQKPVKAGGKKVRFLGVVSAGRSGSTVNDEHEPVDVPDFILRHHDPADVFALDVTGDSMMSDTAIESIPAGSRAFFHSLLRPEPGDIICAYLESEDMSVVKEYRPDNGFTTLHSLNGKHRPIIVDAGNPARLEGVLLAHIARRR